MIFKKKGVYKIKFILNIRRMKRLEQYTQNKIKRKVNLNIPLLGGDNHSKLDNEMVRRGYLKIEPYELMEGVFLDRYVGNLIPISKNSDEKIKEKKNKKYMIDNLSLFDLIESILIEISEESIDVDLLKVEILLFLSENWDFFPNNEKLIYRFREASSIYDAPYFFLVLQSYLYSIGRKLVSYIKHDFKIHKNLNGKLSLTPKQGYDKKFEYFSEMEVRFF
jgi:hypothetical protein